MATNDDKEERLGKQEEGLGTLGWLRSVARSKFEGAKECGEVA